MIVLDTDVLTIIQRGTGEEFSRLVAHLRALPAQSVCVTIIAFEEQIRGWLAFIARARNPAQQIQGYARLRALLSDYQARPILDCDDAAVTVFQRLVKARIATLVTRNTADFRRVSGLKLSPWTFSV